MPDSRIVWRKSATPWSESEQATTLTAGDADPYAWESAGEVGAGMECRECV